LNHYGYLGIFLLLALGIFGPPVADELLLLFLGYLVLKGNLDFIPTIAVGGATWNSQKVPDSYLWLDFAGLLSLIKSVKRETRLSIDC
jgi:hypothetical protein